MNGDFTIKKLNNKGFTLVELLVALAISGIVMVMIGLFMTNSSFIFREENEKIDLQNEFQMVDSFLTETIMEAKTLYITNDSNSQTLTLYTGIQNGNSLEAPTASGETETAAITTERIITFKPDEKSVYITKSYVDNLSKGYLISDNVKEFKVSIDESCITYKEVEDPITRETSLEQDGYANPIILDIELKIVDDKEEKEKTETLKITVRNKLENVVIDGNSYTVK